MIIYNEAEKYQQMQDSIGVGFQRGICFHSTNGLDDELVMKKAHTQKKPRLETSNITHQAKTKTLIYCMVFLK